MNRTRAVLTRGRPPATTDCLIVVDGQRRSVPGWLHEWCRRAGLRLLLAPDPGTGADRVPALARLAGRSGSMVLLPRPGPAPSERPQLVVAAVRDLPGDEPVLARAAQAAAHPGGTLVLVHGVPLSFGERSVGLDAALEHGRRVLDDAAERLATDVPGLLVRPRLLRAHPHELVGEDLQAQLLVIGGPRVADPDRLGLVTSSALHHAPCPVLLVPRPR